MARVVAWGVASFAVVGSCVHHALRDEAIAGAPAEPGVTRDPAPGVVAVGSVADVAWSWMPPPGHHGVGESGRDLFSPPEAWRDAATGRWRRGRAPSVGAAGAVLGAPESSDPAGTVEVLGIVRRSFPWQLVGYAEAGGHPVGLFQEVASGALVWRRGGMTLGDAAFRIESVRVALSAPADGEGQTVERVARAVIRDGATHERHELCTAERLGIGSPRAELRFRSTGRVHLLAEGESVSEGAATFAVAEIDPGQRRVVVRSAHAQTAVTAERVPLHWREETADGAERSGG
jgi:hypothetical protein